MKERTNEAGEATPFPALTARMEKEGKEGGGRSAFGPATVIL